jgi:hypothetical protein
MVEVNDSGAGGFLAQLAIPMQKISPIHPVHLVKRITMRLSGKRMRCTETKLIYFHHRFPPTINEDEPRRPLEPFVRREYRKLSPCHDTRSS